MMKVGIQLEDKDFARALLKGLAAEGRNLCFVLPEQGHEEEWGEMDFDLIVTDREPESGKQIFLCDSPEKERICEGPPYRIFRYRDAKNFVSSLLLICFRETGRNLEFSGDVSCRTLVFTSLSGVPVGTALALAAGEILFRHFGMRCLYLNLCPIDGSKRFLPDDGGIGLLHLLYYLEQERDFPMESFIRTNLHVDYINTNVSNPYFDELSPSLLYRLLKKIDDLGKYTFLILDMGNHFSRNNKKLLAQAEEIILTTDGEDWLSEPFFADFLNLLEGFAAGIPVKIVSLDTSDADSENTPPLLENDLLDLNAMKYVQWEAGRLIKEIMDDTDD